MDNQPTPHELLDKYLDNSITESELTELQSHFNTQEELEQEANMLMAILNGIQVTGYQSVITNMLPDIEQELEEEGFFEKKKNKETASSKGITFWIRRIAAVAAAILFISYFVLKITTNSSYDKILAEAYKTEQLEATNTIQSIQNKIDMNIVGYAGISTEQLILLKKGITAFHKGEAADTQHFLQEFLYFHEEHGDANLYLALTFMKEGKYEQAQALLSKNVAEGYQTKILFFKAMCLMKTGDEEKALVLLKQIESGDSDYAGMTKEIIHTSF